MDKIQYLSQFNLLHALSEEDLIVMDELTSITTYPKKTFIQTPESFREKLYFVKKGKVRLYRINPEGKQFTLDLLSEGNVFGELNGISLGTRNVFIETIVESDICMIDQNRFEIFLFEHPRFMLNMLKVLSERLVHMSSLAQNLALGRLHDKIMHVFQKLSRQFGIQREQLDGDYYKIDIPLSHQEIAHLVGASREAVTLALQELAEAKAIKTDFRTIYIHCEQLNMEHQ
ncbi:Crp/Fnr family transcriptional regulator [Paenibacillus donghaensis]|uniref:Crp/Fnr family transcriptional regulator n=1 Tax=Paenibacillus donghaensis TaxID=414771 RepID=UPI001883A975|nr:Crp/Fnr family transcriptional regulator [Paenibacillus donghaensis]MBE9914316.1 Crp/Fnr family transcriptional regulator [Paenibacillus donghaensis]